MFTLLEPYSKGPIDDDYELSRLDDSVFLKAAEDALNRGRLSRQEYWQAACIFDEILARGSARDYLIKNILGQEAAHLDYQLKQHFIATGLGLNQHLRGKSYRFHIVSARYLYTPLDLYMAECLSEGREAELLNQIYLSETAKKRPFILSDEAIDKDLETLQDLTRKVLSTQGEICNLSLRDNLFRASRRGNDYKTTVFTTTFSLDKGRPQNLYLNCSTEMLRSNDPGDTSNLIWLRLLGDRIPARLHLSWEVKLGAYRDYEKFPSYDNISATARSLNLYAFIAPPVPTRVGKRPGGLEFLPAQAGPDVLVEIGESREGTVIGPVQVGAGGPGGGGNWGDSGVLKPELYIKPRSGRFPVERFFCINNQADAVIESLGEAVLQNSFSQVYPAGNPPDSAEFVELVNLPGKLREMGYGDYLDSSLEGALASKVTFFRAPHAPIYRPACGGVKPPKDPVVGVTFAPDALEHFYGFRNRAPYWLVYYATPEGELAREIRREFTAYVGAEASQPVMVTGYARDSKHDYIMLFANNMEKTKGRLQEFFAANPAGIRAHQPRLKLMNIGPEKETRLTAPR